MNSFRFAFFGSPDYARIVLSCLISADMKPEFVVCNPDKPVGRKKVLTSPPVKELALEHSIEVFQPATKSEISDLIPRLKELDFSVVAAYSKILPKEVVDAARLGTLGVHPSWLPKYRGPSPIRTALLDGVDKTAVVIYKMDEGMDSGPTLWGQPFDLTGDEYLEEIAAQLWEAGGKGLVKLIPDFVEGAAIERAQDHSKATFTKMFSTADGEVDMQKDSAQTIYRKVRALNPEPGVFTFNFPGREGKRVKILKAHLEGTSLVTDVIKPEGKGEIKLN
ncbi:MAG: methionyl-tRNA formyltransferase [Candidatus Paceibacterota bacterium]